jgi:hypothetical protein
MAVPLVPKDTSALGAAIAAKPLLMAVSGDRLFLGRGLGNAAAQ